jgi:FkbM family methyltransferase
MSEYKARQCTIDDALSSIGRNKKTRKIFVSALREIESVLTTVDFDSRREIITPILDALHKEVPVLKKTVRVNSSWPSLEYTFYYSSQIARGIVLSYPEISDHIWEPQTTKLLLHLSEDTLKVAIGGAYSGDHAILVAQMLQAGPDGSKTEVHCFEMDESQLRLCQKNAEENRLFNLIYHHAGLYFRDDVALKLVGTDALCHAEVVPHDTPSSIKATTLERVAIDYAIDRYDVIMLDIEGGELNALKGGTDFLAKPINEAPDLIFEVHRNYVDWSMGLEETEIIRFLRNYGYHVYAIRDFQDNVDLRDYPIELIPPEKCVLDGPPHGFNMVAVKNVGRLKGRMFRYVNNVSPKLLRHGDPRLHSPGGH